MHKWLVEGLQRSKLTLLDGFDPPENFFYSASGWYDAGTLIASKPKSVVVKTYPIPNHQKMCIIGCHYVFALHHAEEKRQGTSALQPGGKPAGGQRPGGAAARALLGRDQRQSRRGLAQDHRDFPGRPGAPAHGGVVSRGSDGRGGRRGHRADSAQRTFVAPAPAMGRLLADGPTVGTVGAGSIL